MIAGLWGKKIGMTQIFNTTSKVMPVTVIDCSGWRVLDIKTVERNGYAALLVGCLRKKYSDQLFDASWLHDITSYFSCTREIKGAPVETMNIGDNADVAVLSEVAKVNITGTTIGRGFQGGVKRYGFKGGPGSHGGKLGRKIGSLGNMRSQGRVLKGKRMPGHLGVDTCVVRNLEVVMIKPEASLLLVKGSVPGKTGSLLFIQKV